MAVKHPKTVGEPEKFETKAFFGDVLPKILKAAEPTAKNLGGVYVFKLSGKGGGDWTVDLPALEVRQGAAKKANLTLTMPADDFDGLLSGRLDVAKAVDAGRIDFDGDLGRLSGLRPWCGRRSEREQRAVRPVFSRV